jgi:hypothetical protein
MVISGPMFTFIVRNCHSGQPLTTSRNVVPRSFTILPEQGRPRTSAGLTAIQLTLNGCREQKESLPTLSVHFPEPPLLARITADVDANVAWPRSNRFHGRRIARECAAGRTSDRIMPLRSEMFFIHCQLSQCNEGTIPDLSGT